MEKSKFPKINDKTTLFFDNERKDVRFFTKCRYFLPIYKRINMTKTKADCIKKPLYE